MITAEAAVDVDAPAAEAWAVVADYARDPEWRTGVRSMVPTPAGPVRPGTTTAEVLRAAGRTTHNDGLVTAVDPGRRFTWRTTAGVRAEGSRAVVVLDDGSCRVELSVRAEPPGPLRLVPWLVGGAVRRGLRRDAARLRALVETGGTDDGDGVDLTENGWTVGADTAGPVRPRLVPGLVTLSAGHMSRKKNSSALPSGSLKDSPRP